MGRQENFRTSLGAKAPDLLGILQWKLAFQAEMSQFIGAAVGEKGVPVPQHLAILRDPINNGLEAQWGRRQGWPPLEQSHADIVRLVPRKAI